MDRPTELVETKIRLLFSKNMEPYWFLQEKQLVRQFMAWRFVQRLADKESQFVRILAWCWHTDRPLKQQIKALE